MDKFIKSRPLYLAKILYERTDEEHSLSTAELMEILKNQYGIPTHRTTIPADIEILQRFGLDIQAVRTSQMRYNLVSRTFEDAELKLLIDAVESAKFITKQKSELLAEKIALLAGGSRASEMMRNVSVERRYKADNRIILNIIDAVNTAINHGKQIAFQYFEYTPTKEKQLRYEGYRYRFSPYKLVWNGDYYYIVGYYAKYEKVMSFRVDRIAAVPEELEDAAVPLPEDFDLDSYLNTMFHMFSTERERVELLVSNDCMGALIDRFGEDVETEVFDEDTVKATVEIAVNNVFYSWIFGFAGKVKILGPERVKDGYVEMVKLAGEFLLT